MDASDRVCGKRLKALLPTLVPALERHGHVTLDPRVREQLMAVSAATIDRRLASARAVTAGQRRRRRSGGDSVRGRVPVRTFGDWQDPVPGFVEADLVAHCGSSMAGSFVWTLVLTDIASGWTECVPLLVRAAGVVVDAVDRLRGALPFPLRGIDTDNGSEFSQRGVDRLLQGARHRADPYAKASHFRRAADRGRAAGSADGPGIPADRRPGGGDGSAFRAIAQHFGVDDHTVAKAIRWFHQVPP